MKTIIVSTDFTAISLNAVNYAADMACVINTDLSILHVCPIPVVLNEVPLPPYTLEELVEDAAQKMTPLKQKMESRTGKKIKISTTVKTGELIAGINDHCNLLDVYAVVMGVEDSGALDRFLFGSKTLSAITQLECPVIAVPTDVKFTNIQKIGLACDFRRVLETIPVEEIKKLVNNFNAELYVLHVSPQNNLFKKEIDEGLEWLHSILGGMHPVYHFINGNDIEKGIAEFAEKVNLDLLITIPKKHNFISKFFQHSHSKELVLNSHVPVMAIHE